MATINNAISGAYNSGAVRSTQNEMNELRNQYRGKEIDSKEYKEKMNVLKEQQTDARMNAAAAGVAAADNVSSLFSYMNNSSNNGAPGIWGGGTFDTSVFTSGKGELSNLQAMNSARIGIENRARTLVGEIGRDRAMGRDVSDKQGALSNLTGNLDILSKNLSSSVEKALGDGSKDSNFVDIVGKIRESLKPKEAEAVAPDTATQETIAPDVVKSDMGLADVPSHAAPSAEAIKEDIAVQSPAVQPQEMEDQPSYAAPTVFEGSVSEQVAQAAAEQEPGEMSIASQIANNAVSDYAESVNIMEDNNSAPAQETFVSGSSLQTDAPLVQAQEHSQSATVNAPENAVEMGVTPANV